MPGVAIQDFAAHYPDAFDGRDLLPSMASQVKRTLNELLAFFGELAPGPINARKDQAGRACRFKQVVTNVEPIWPDEIGFSSA